MEMLSTSSTLKADVLRAPSAVRVLFFGPIRTQLGIEACDVSCLEELSIDQLWSELSDQFNALKPMRAIVRLARNGEFLESSELIHPGDEIALIPPVSGG